MDSKLDEARRSAKLDLEKIIADPRTAACFVTRLKACLKSISLGGLEKATKSETPIKN